MTPPASTPVKERGSKNLSSKGLEKTLLVSYATLIIHTNFVFFFVFVSNLRGKELCSDVTGTLLVLKNFIIGIFVAIS